MAESDVIELDRAAAGDQRRRELTDDRADVAQRGGAQRLFRPLVGEQIDLGLPRDPRVNIGLKRRREVRERDRPIPILPGNRKNRPRQASPLDDAVPGLNRPLPGLVRVFGKAAVGEMTAELLEDLIVHGLRRHAD